MKFFAFSWCLVVFACCSLLTRAAEALPFTIQTDVTAAPECQDFAEKSATLCREWYPKINEILFAKDRPLPAEEVRLIFAPMKGVAHTTNAQIHVAADWVTKKHPDDYGMVIHELTHVVQDYRGKVKGEDGWLTEGIADYIRHKYFEKDIEKLRVNPDRNHYKQGYTIAAAFLFWLESKKDAELVHKLNAALHDGNYSTAMFQQTCGAPLDDLWKEFTDAQRAAN
jgi:hypothetical protein